MNLAGANQIQTNYYSATQSGAYLDWKLEQLIGVQGQLREARAILLSEIGFAQGCDRALETINQTIDAKRAEAKSDTRYEEDQKRQARTEFRANLAIGISIAGFVASTALGVVGYLANRPIPILVPVAPKEAPTANSPSPLPSQSP